MAQPLVPDQSPEAQPHEAAAAKAMAAGDAAGAARLLERAIDQGPGTVSLHLSLAAVRRRLADVDGALASVERALALEPRHFTSLLMRASLLERLGHAREAGAAYGVALTQAPPALDRLDRPTQQAVAHAREVHARHVAEMSDRLHEQSLSALARCTPAEAARARALVEDLLGRRKRYRQEPSAFYYPGLPAVEFYDRDAFAWLEDLEATTDVIAAELALILSEPAAGFVPYVDYHDSLPLDQWRALNRSPDWGAFHIFLNGAPVAENAARCPRTVEVLAHMPQPQLPGRSPSAMFSVLRPHTRIPPHTGVSNTRLVVHLPLIVPPGCRFRVGNETRTWERGRAWVFDDTVEHEAVNDSDQDRIILIFDIAQPAISPAEHAAIAAIAQALDEFRGVAPDAGL